jgi:hypothetical protein
MEIERLRVKLAEATKDRSVFFADLVDTKSRLAEAERVLFDQSPQWLATVKDAKRYRNIRENRQARVALIGHFKDSGPEALDDAVDEAMGESRE